MCYAIPGKVLDISNNIATIDYFGETKEAIVDAGNIRVGDYVFAQGGLIVGTLKEDEAHGILEGWKEAFFKLRDRDERLAEDVRLSGGADPAIARIIKKGEEGAALTRDEMLALMMSKSEEDLNLLYQTANSVRRRRHRNSSCVHGIIEFSNMCKNDCAYCGISRHNNSLTRYRMDADEIVDVVIHAAEKLGFKAFVLQSGEDDYYTTSRLIGIIRKIKEMTGVLVILSIGERDMDCYKELYDAGARGILMRFETSNPNLYGRLHTTLNYEGRLRTLRGVRDIGYLVATGSLIGLPAQRDGDLVEDILLASSFDTEMYSFGPFIPHPGTPLASSAIIDIHTVLKVIAVTRLFNHDGNIVVTSALESLFGIEGAKKALMAGGNSMMIDLTPEKYRRLYAIYPGKGEGDDDIQGRISGTISLLYSLGRAPTDLGITWGTKEDENQIKGSRGQGFKGSSEEAITASISAFSLHLTPRPLDPLNPDFQKAFSDEIERILDRTHNASHKKAESIIAKAKQLKGLTPEETAILLQCEDKDLLESLYSAAREVKESIYGKRLVLFAPLYLTSTCVNNCLYCGFRRENQTIERRVLTGDEIRLETEALIRDGHKRALLVAGEDHRQCGIDYIEKAIGIIYSTKVDNGNIRRVNVNVAPLSVEEFKRLKSAGIGTYQLFQETYHLPTYKQVHPSGPKSNYDYRLSALSRAMEAGIDDVGMGVLFGLYDYKFEVLAILYHALHLEQEFGVGPHTISVPRIEPASGAPLSVNPPCAVSDEDFMKLVAILRLAIPYTGIILSTREHAGLRNRLFHIGASQISTNSRTYPGGYTAGDDENSSRGQFSIGDKRTTAEVIQHISTDGFAPSFCTACYRTGRTGQEFMEFAKPGDIQRFCLPNSILSFKEYLLDYGGEELRKIGENLIDEQIFSIDDIKIRLATLKKLEDMEKGKRDLYF
ncbi:MAG: [FeFe] hydrogenase H-cluster radical SAM maturase HydG [Nitrospirae bacterium]|nr:[FeFe] hydrogenase H-cluster radical SAM maturase HydG [Nitrospirota bacterium]